MIEPCSPLSMQHRIFRNGLVFWTVAVSLFWLVAAQNLESDDLKASVVDGGHTILAPKDWMMATRFAPVFYQETSTPRTAIPPLAKKSDNPFDADEEEVNPADFITRVDFDGNWIAYDNWANFDSPKADFRAFVYFSTAETLTHVFISYTVFHPRDVGSIHENDLEGAIVCVEKGEGRRPDRLVYVQTLAHNVFYKYYNPETVEGKNGAVGPDPLLMEGNHPLLFIEARGHGVKRYDGKERPPGLAPRMFIVYRCKGRAESPRKAAIGNVGYDLIPLQSTLWKAAHIDSEVNATFTDFRDYGEFELRVAKGSSAAGTAANAAGDRVVLRKLTRVGASLIGKHGRPNAAHPPWGWSLDGRWFFLPAEEFKKDFRLGEDFSVTYTHHPFLQIYRSANRPPSASRAPSKKS